MSAFISVITMSVICSDILSIKLYVLTGCRVLVGGLGAVCRLFRLFSGFGWLCCGRVEGLILGVAGGLAGLNDKMNWWCLCWEGMITTGS